MNDGKDRHDAVVEAVTTAGRSVIIAGATVVIAVLGLVPDRPALHVRRRDLGLARGARRDARLDHAAAGAALLPRPEGRPAADPVPRPRAEGRGQTASRPRRAGATPSSAGRGRRDRRDRAAARAGGARARHAARLPRRRQRPAGHDDAPGLRPQHRGLRARHERAARDRRRAARPGREGATSRRSRERVRSEPGVAFVRRPAFNDGGRRGDRHRDPERLPAGRGDRGPRQPPARRRRAGGARRHRHQRRDRRRDGGARGPERVHEGPHAAVHRRRGRALLPAPAGRVPLAADLAEGGRS